MAIVNYWFIKKVCRKVQSGLICQTRKIIRRQCEIWLVIAFMHFTVCREVIMAFSSFK